MRRLRRLGIGIGGFLAVFFTVYTGVYLTWNDAWIARTVSGWVSKPMRGAGGPTKQAFVIGRAHYPYWGSLRSLFLGGPAWVEMWDTTIWDPDGKEVLHAPYARGQFWIGSVVWSQFFSLFPWQAWYLELHFANADVKTARCRIALDSDGNVNLVDAMTSKKKSPPRTTGGMRIRLDSATVHDGEFAIEFPSWRAAVHHIAAGAKLSYSSWPEEEATDLPGFRYEVTPLAAKSGELVLGSDGKFTFPIEDIVATRFGAFEPERQHMVYAATMRTRGADVAATGRLTDCYSKHPGVDLSLRFVHGAGLLAMLPTGELLGGDPSGEARIHGPFTDVTIEGRGSGAEVRLAGLVATAAQSSFRLRANDGVLHLSEARAAVGGGAIRGAVDVDFGRGRWSADLAGERVDPARLAPLVPAAAGPLLGGAASGHVHVEGSLVDHPERIRVRDVDVRLRRRAKDRLPPEIEARGGLRISPRAVQLDALSLSGDGATLTSRGEVDVRSGALRGEVTLDAGRLSPLLRRLGLSGVEATAVHASATVSGRALAPVLDGHLAAGVVDLGGVEIPQLAAHLTLDEGTLRATDIRAGGALHGGPLGEVAIGLFDGDLSHVRADPTLLVRLEAARLAIEALARLPWFTGVVSGRISLDGTVSRPTGQADLEIPRMALFGDPYRHGVISIGIRPGGVDVRRLSLQREGGGSLEGRAGTIDSDGAIDLELITRDFPLAAIPQLRDVGIPLGGTLSGRVRIGGDLKRWSLEGAIEASAIRVREILLGDGRLKLIPGGDAIHLSGEFFDRFKVDGYLTLAPRVAATVEISFDDFPLEEMIPELRQFAEMTWRVSGQARVSVDQSQGLWAELRLRKVLLTLAREEGEDGGRETVEFANGGCPGGGACEVIITTDGKKLTVRQAHFRGTHHGASAGDNGDEFEVYGDLSAEKSDLQVRGGIELGLFEYFFSSLFEHTHGKARADLHITGPRDRPELEGWLELADASVKPRGADRSVLVPSGRLLFAPGNIQMTDLKVRLDDAEVSATGSLAIQNWHPGAIALDLKGQLAPAMVGMVAQLAGADWWGDHIGDPTGRLDVQAEVRGTFARPEWLGTVRFTDVAFKEKRIGKDVRIAAGTVVLDGFDVALGCPPRGRETVMNCKTIVAKIDETGEVRFDGVVSLAGFRLARVDLRLEGDDLDWSTPVYSLRFSPRLDLIGNAGALKLSGTLALVEGRYQEPFDYKDLILKPQVLEVEPPFWEGIELLEKLALDVAVTSAGTLAIKNNIADLNVNVPRLVIRGTLDHPNFDGAVFIEEGGRFQIPLLRANFLSDRGSIVFEPRREFPSRTPRLDFRATAEWRDRYEQVHVIFLTLRGTYAEPDLDLRSSTGWDKAQVLAALLTGVTPDQLRRVIQATPTSVSESARGGGASTADNLLKVVSNQLLGGWIEDPLKTVFRLDVARVELGVDSVFVNICPWVTERLRVCGTGDVGFVTTTRYSGSLELKMTDFFSVLGLAERVERGLDTTQDIVNRLRFQLRLRYPIFGR